MEATKNKNKIHILQKENQKLPKINQSQVLQKNIEEEMYLNGNPHIETSVEDKEIMCPPIEDRQNTERRPTKLDMPRVNFLNKKMKDMNYDNKLTRNIQKSLGNQVVDLKSQIIDKNIIITETPKDLNKYIIRSGSTDNNIIKYSNVFYELKKKHKLIKDLKEEQAILKSKLDKIEENEALLNSEGIKKLNNSSENLTKFDKSIKEQQIKLNKNKKIDIIERIKEIDFRINQILELENSNNKLTKQERLDNYLKEYERDKDIIEERARKYLKETKRKQNNLEKENQKLAEEFKKKFEEKQSQKEELTKKFIKDEKEIHDKRIKKMEELEKKVMNPKHPFDLSKLVKNKSDYKYIKYDKNYKLKEERLQDKVNFERKMKNKTVTPEELEKFLADIEKKKEELKIKKEKRDKKEIDLMEMCKNYKPSYTSKFTEMVDNEYINNLEKERIKKDNIMHYNSLKLDCAKKANKKYEVDEKLKKERMDRIIALENPKLVQIKDTLNRKKGKKIVLKKRDPTKPSKYKFFEEFEETLKKLNNSAELDKQIKKRPKSIKFASSFSVKEEDKKDENDNKNKQDKEKELKKIDYINELRQKRLLKEKREKESGKNDNTKKDIDKQNNREFKITDENYIENIYNTKVKADNLKSKAKMEEELLKYNGGIKKNPEAGKKICGYLIDSIEAKLSILNEMYKNN